MNGEVVGITTAKYSGSTSSGASIEGISFAIPINEALRGSFYRDPAVEACIGAYEKRVLEDKISSFIAAKELLEIYFKDARTLE